MLRHVVVERLELRLLLLLMLRWLVRVVGPWASVLRHHELKRQLHMALRVVIIALKVLWLLMRCWHELLMRTL